jgi:hypothetical protein
MGAQFNDDYRRDIRAEHVAKNPKLAKTKAQIAEVIQKIIGDDFEVTLELASKYQLDMRKVSQLKQINKWKAEQRKRASEFLGSNIESCL